MTRLSAPGNVCVKFEMSPELKARFLATCKLLGISQSKALRLFIQTWIEDVEEQMKDDDDTTI